MRPLSGEKPETFNNRTGREISSDLVRALKRVQLHYSTEPRDLFYVVSLDSGICGVIGDGDNGCYEWFVQEDGAELRTSDRAYGQPETALRDVVLQQFSVGIDLPGVGLTRPEVSSDCAGRESAVSGVLRGPAGGALRSFLDGESLDLAESPKDRRERLFAQLAFAAKDLADAQIEPADGPDEPAFCTECVEDEYRGLIMHEPGCCTGRVLGLIADLIGTLVLKPDPKEAAAEGETPEAGDGIRLHGLYERGEPDLKEAAAEGETPEAGDGIRLHGLYERGDVPAAIDLLCLACGERGGGWLRGRAVERGEAIAHVGNQRLAEDADGSGFYLYTHQCAVAEGGAQ